MSFNLRHAISCDLLHWACVCVCDEGSTVETAEKLDNQNGMMPGSGTARKLGLNAEFDV